MTGYRREGARGIGKAFNECVTKRQVRAAVGMEEGKNEKEKAGPQCRVPT